MAKKSSSDHVGGEINAISAVYDALKLLQPDAQVRVIDYVAGMLRVAPTFPRAFSTEVSDVAPESVASPERERVRVDQVDATLDGISSVAVKWMKRAGLTTAELAQLYSVGGDEIDLITTSVPGKSVRQRMHSVILLKAIAAYLGTGAPRVSHDQLKETCLHYDAYDSPNFAKHLKSFASEVTGTKQSGYSLTQRGLAAATELIRQMMVSP